MPYIENVYNKPSAIIYEAFQMRRSLVYLYMYAYCVYVFKANADVTPRLPFN